MTLWGKTPQQLQAERNQMILEREEIARRDEELRQRRAPSPMDLGRHYGAAMQPVRRDYHFGTDIPITSNAEVQETMNIPRSKWPVIIGAAIGAWLLFAFVAAILYLALT